MQNWMKRSRNKNKYDTFWPFEHKLFPLQIYGPIQKSSILIFWYDFFDTEIYTLLV